MTTFTLLFIFLLLLILLHNCFLKLSFDLSRLVLLAKVVFSLTNRLFKKLYKRKPNIYLGYTSQY